MSDSPRAVDAATLLAWKNRTCTTVHPCHWDCGDIRSAAAELLALRAAPEPAECKHSPRAETVLWAAECWRKATGNGAYIAACDDLVDAVDHYLAARGAPE